MLVGSYDPQNRPEMAYNVSSGTSNPTVSYLTGVDDVDRSSGVSHRGGTPVGVEAARRPFTARPAQHSGLLQHKTLHAADSCRTPGSVVLTHHETLEEDELAKRQAGPERLPALLLTSTVQ